MASAQAEMKWVYSREGLDGQMKSEFSMDGLYVYGHQMFKTCSVFYYGVYFKQEVHFILFFFFFRTMTKDIYPRSASFILHV